MASSQQPRAASQRSSSPGRSSSPLLDRRSSQTQSATSEDSQTVLLHKPSSESSPIIEKSRTSDNNNNNNNNEPRKCWICFSDETEDTPTSSAWRSPCPCALRAHESCLLDWVADLEAPNRKRRRGRQPKIECPQCKTEIIIARPRSYIVDGVNAVEAATGRLILPIVLVTVASSLLAGCWLHGYSTIYVLFGTQDARRVLALRHNSSSVAGILGIVKISAGLQFIPIILILSRTSLVDSILPVLPIFFLGSKIPRRQGSSFWPPSAAMVLATLPYLRGIYNEFYKRVLAPRERAWLKEIQPRAGENENPGDNGAAENDNENENQAEGGLNFELGLEVEIFDQEAPIPPPEPAQPDAQPDGQPNDNHPAPQPPIAPAPPADPPRQQNIILSTTRLADTIIGALLFPSISASVGALLALVLPRSWTARPPGFWGHPGAPTGLLQSRFGRSVVGGCLFVVLKDAVVLYSRFRLARAHRERRVLDWKGEGKRR